MQSYQISGTEQTSNTLEVLTDLDAQLASKIDLMMSEHSQAHDCTDCSWPIYRSCISWCSFAVCIWACVAFCFYN